MHIFIFKYKQIYVMMTYTHSTSLLHIFVISVLLSEFRHTYANTEKTCSSAYYRRKPCGYKYISQSACQERGCCYNSTPIHGIPKCYKSVKANVDERCFPGEHGRQPCGYRFITMYQCQLRGCCFKKSRSHGVPSCYKPTISFHETTTITPTTIQLQTNKPPQLRSAHGEESEATNTQVSYETADMSDIGSVSPTLLEIFLRMNVWQNANRSCDVRVASRNDCGHPGITKDSCESKNCCWDDSTLHSHWCFYPVWRSLGSHHPLNDFGSLTSELQSGSGENPTVQPTEDSTDMNQPPIPTTNYAQYWEETTSSYEDDTTVSDYVSLSTHAYSTPYDRPGDMDTTTSPPTTTTEILPPYEDPFDPPEEDEDVQVYPRVVVPNTLPYSHHQMSTSTTITTQMPTPEPNKNDWKNVIKILNYYSVIHRSKPMKLDRGLTTTCSVGKSSCCLSNPNAPCCEYSNDAPERLTRSSNPESRIVGGGIAGHLRSSVAYLTVKNFASQFCGGTLIRSNWVVTAAHCVVDYCNGKKPVSEIIVKLGKTDKSNFVRGRFEQAIPASEVICHSHNCKSANQPRLNDIALVKLSRPATRNMYVSPAALPYHGEIPVMNKKCIVLGWGETRGRGPKSNVLKEVDVPLFSNQQCNKPDWRNCAVRACMMCAGELNADACEGDSGGPLFCQRPGELYVLHGVYSWGRCGAESKKPAVYTRFPYYVNWIKRQIYARS